MQPRALILHANGTNRDNDVAYAFELAGAQPEILTLNQLKTDKTSWQDYQILVIPGGFSYADTLGAGRLFALDLRTYFADEIKRFIESGKPVIGICNGFQALIKAGLLPDFHPEKRSSTLTYNAHGQFECRWVTLLAESNECLWTRDLNEPIYCPIAHGEGRFVTSDASIVDELRKKGQIALRYANDNPNGSVADIAGVCNEKGNVLGLMPHPENHVLAQQHPRWTRGESGELGLPLFMNGVNFVR